MSLKKFRIDWDGPEIILSGDLCGDDADLLKAFFASLPAGTYFVQAAQITLDPDGATAWINSVNGLSSDRILHYDESQLAIILEYDERYIR